MPIKFFLVSSTALIIVVFIFSVKLSFDDCQQTATSDFKIVSTPNMSGFEHFVETDSVGEFSVKYYVVGKKKIKEIKSLSIVLPKDSTALWQVTTLFPAEVTDSLISVKIPDDIRYGEGSKKIEIFHINGKLKKHSPFCLEVKTTVNRQSVYCPTAIIWKL